MRARRSIVDGPGGRAAPSLPLARVMAMPLPVTLLVLVFAYWCVDIVSPALPTIQESLALSATGAGFVFSVFFGGRLITNLPAAWLAERVGPKWTAVIGAAVLLAGSLLAGIATGPVTLLPARGVQGAGVALLATAGLLSVLRALPAGGAAMTAFNVTSGVGSSFGLLTGGFLTSEFGWRAVFWLASLVSAVLLVSALLARPQPATRRLTHPDREDGGLAPAAPRTAEVAAIAANFLVFANYAIWVVSLPLLGAEKFGFDGGEVGLLLLFINIVHLASALPIGRAIRKTGASRSLAAGFGIAGAGMLLLPLAPSLPWLLAPAVLYAIGQVAGNSSAGDLILRLGGGGGRAVGAVRLSSDIGMVAGPAVAGILADVAGIEAPFVGLGLLAMVAMVATIVASKRPAPGQGGMP